MTVDRRPAARRATDGGARATRLPPVESERSTFHVEQRVANYLVLPLRPSLAAARVRLAPVDRSRARDGHGYGQGRAEAGAQPVGRRVAQIAGHRGIGHSARSTRAHAQ